MLIISNVGAATLGAVLALCLWEFGLWIRAQRSLLEEELRGLKAHNRKHLSGYMEEDKHLAPGFAKGHNESGD